MFCLVVDPHLRNVFGYFDMMRLHSLGNPVDLDGVGFGWHHQFIIHLVPQELPRLSLDLEGADLNWTQHVDDGDTWVGGLAVSAGCQLSAVAVYDVLAAFDVELCSEFEFGEEDAV